MNRFVKPDGLSCKVRIFIFRGGLLGGALIPELGAQGEREDEGKLPAEITLPARESTYKLVWSDEFNTDGAPNEANWNFEKGFTRNHEWQWYQKQNAFCENGLLVIEARRGRS